MLSLTEYAADRRPSRGSYSRRDQLVLHVHVAQLSRELRAPKLFPPLVQASTKLEAVRAIDLSGFRAALICNSVELIPTQRTYPSQSWLKRTKRATPCGHPARRIDYNKTRTSEKTW
jgi:hypothetical protein